MSTVYIPSLPTRWDRATQTRVPSIDVNPADQFGTLEVITHGAGTDQQSIDSAVNKIKRGLAGITADDCILATGHIVLCALAISLMMDKVGTARVLMWDRASKSYAIVRLDDYT